MGDRVGTSAEGGGTENHRHKRNTSNKQGEGQGVKGRSRWGLRGDGGLNRITGRTGNGGGPYNRGLSLYPPPPKTLRK